MTKQDKSKIQLPIEIEFLFNNKELSLFQYLVIMYFCLKDNRKRKLTIEQLLYFYTYTTYELDGMNVPLIYKYNNDRNKILEIIIALSSIGFIKVEGDIITSTSKLKIIIMKQGIDFIEGVQEPILKNYIDVIRDVIQRNPYDKGSINFKKILYEGNNVDEDK